jgi:hypothetical protein
MKPITAVICAVGRGGVTVKFRTGGKAVFKTDRGFKFGERVFVLYDHHLLVIKDVFYPKELDISDEVAPKCSADKRTEDDKVLDDGVGDSLSTPDGRSLDFCEPEPGLEYGVEVGDSLLPSDGRLLEFVSGDD